MSVILTVSDDENDTEISSLYTFLRGTLDNPTLLDPHYDKSTGHLAGGVLVGIGLAVSTLGVGIAQAATYDACKACVMWLRGASKSKRVLITIGEKGQAKEILFESDKLPDDAAIRKIAEEIANHV